MYTIRYGYYLFFRCIALDNYWMELLCLKDLCICRTLPFHDHCGLWQNPGVVLTPCLCYCIHHHVNPLLLNLLLH